MRKSLRCDWSNCHISTNHHLCISISAQTEVNKLQQHLALLKDQYAKLQAKYNDLEKKYYNISAGMQDTEDTFAARLLKTVATVHDTATFSDITITLGQGKVTHAHKLVLCARSELFDEAALQQSQLDWSEVDADVGTILIRWLYTDEIGFSDDEITLKLIRKAHEFHLNGLVSACEQKLIASVEVRTCVKFYSVAEEIEAEELRAYCSALISAHWDDLDRGDFEHMSGPLLYKMLKSKTQLPLHAAVRLQREDVVFLCLVENASRVSTS